LVRCFFFIKKLFIKKFNLLFERNFYARALVKELKYFFMQPRCQTKIFGLKIIILKICKKKLFFFKGECHEMLVEIRQKKIE
jgi:hypothetical protein